MNVHQLDDLKQFISSVVSQTEARLDARLVAVEVRLGALENRVSSLEDRVSSLEYRLGSLEDRVGSLEKKIDDGFAGIGQVIQDMITLNEARFSKHESRLTRLEHRTA